MKLAIMQPYLFPYIGYFQLINAVDNFVVYDDVNYIKQGWINRNRILLNGQPHYITINLNGASSFKKINEIEINFKPLKLLKTLQQYYKKAPYFNEIYALTEKVLFFEEKNLAKFTTNSLRVVCEYLNINTKFEISSQHNIDRELRGEDRVIEICKYFGAEEYINAIGGKNLYSHKRFAENNIKLYFLKTSEIVYEQFKNEFVPNLSIIDVMMFNSKEVINKMLDNYELI